MEELLLSNWGLTIILILIVVFICKIISIKRKIFGPKPLVIPEIEVNWSKAHAELDWREEQEKRRKKIIEAQLDLLASIFISVVTVATKAVVLTVATSITGAIAKGLENKEKQIEAETVLIN